MTKTFIVRFKSNSQWGERLDNITVLCEMFLLPPEEYFIVFEKANMPPQV